MLDISSINPYIRVAMQSVLNKGKIIASRIIFDYELLYVEDGEFVLNYNGCDYNCTKGQFVLIRPGVTHSFLVTKTNLSQPHIHFDITAMPDSRQVPICFKDITYLTTTELKKIRKDVFKNYPQTPFVTFSDTTATLRLFYSIINQPKGCELTQKGLLTQLIDMLITDNFPKAFDNSAEVVYSIEEQVKDYIDAGQGMAFSLQDIARQFNYSKYYLERRFKERYNISLIAYRNNKRMQLAKTMLINDTVSNVAEKLGFSSIYVFSRAFKNHFGYSPTVRRK